MCCNINKETNITKYKNYENVQFGKCNKVPSKLFNSYDKVVKFVNF